MIGSDTPSQSEVKAIVAPTTTPGKPITLVAKNMIKELTVCPILP